MIKLLLNRNQVFEIYVMTDFEIDSSNYSVVQTNHYRAALSYDQIDYENYINWRAKFSGRVL
jgi:hypothetical protein